MCFFSSILLAHFISHSDTEAFCSFPSFSVYAVHIHHTSVNIWTNFFVENFFFTVYYPVSHEKLMKRHSFAFSFSFSFYCSICILPLMKDNQKSIHRLSWRAQNCWALSHIDRLRLWLLFTLAKQMCALQPYFLSLFHWGFFFASLKVKYLCRECFQKVCVSDRKKSS